MRDTMETIGVGLDVQTGVNTVWMETVFEQHDFDLSLSRSSLGADPSLGMSRWYACNPDNLTSRNPSGVCDEELQAAADGAVETADRDGRVEHFHVLQERAAELMYHAPLAWSTASFPSINTTRWNGLDNNDYAAGTVNWLELEWIG